MKKINLGIIGMGHVYDHQIKALNQVKEINLISVSDIDEKKEYKTPPNVKFYRNYQEMVDKEKLDAVLISVPNKFHYEITKFCLKSNINVLLEKPAVLNLNEFDDLITISKINNLILVIAFHAMFARDLLWFLDKYKESLYNELGNITYFYCGFYDPYVENGKLKEQAKSLIGSWIDSGINALSVVGKFVNDLEIEESKLTFISNINEFGEIQGSVLLRFKSNRSISNHLGIIDTNWTLGINCKKTHLKFENPEKEIVLNHSKQQVILRDRNSLKILADFSNTGERLVNHYIGVFKDFVNCYKNKTNNLEYAYPLHKILLNAVKLNGEIKGCH